MKKTLLFISTGFVVVTLFAALFGKITFEQFGYITPLVLSIVYGIYQKVLGSEKDETIESLNIVIEDIIKKSNSDIKYLEKENHLLVDALLKDKEASEVIKECDCIKEVGAEKVVTPKKTRKTKK